MARLGEAAKAWLRCLSCVTADGTAPSAGLAVTAAPAGPGEELGACCPFQGHALTLQPHLGRSPCARCGVGAMSVSVALCVPNTSLVGSPNVTLVSTQTPYFSGVSQPGCTEPFPVQGCCAWAAAASSNVLLTRALSPSWLWGERRVLGLELLGQPGSTRWEQCQRGRLCTLDCESFICHLLSGAFPKLLTEHRHFLHRHRPVLGTAGLSPLWSPTRWECKAWLHPGWSF